MLYLLYFPYFKGNLQKVKYEIFKFWPPRIASLWTSERRAQKQTKKKLIMQQKKLIIQQQKTYYATKETKNFKFWPLRIASLWTSERRARPRWHIPSQSKAGPRSWKSIWAPGNTHSANFQVVFVFVLFVLFGNTHSSNFQVSS